MTKLLQILLCGLVVVAPWLCGAATSKPQFYLAVVLVPIGLLRFIQRLFEASEKPLPGIPTAMLCGLGLLGIGVTQLIPLGGGNPLSSLSSVVMGDVFQGGTQPEFLREFARGLHTVSPVATQLTLSQLCLAVLAFWLSFDLFEDSKSRSWFYLILALNGATIAGFGIAQKMTWNGMLFWSIPLRFGGSPFGPFVNRNNAAGYLLLSFSCAIACLVSAWFPFGLGPRKVAGVSVQNRFTQLLTRSLGQITPAVMIPLALVLAIVGGILTSLSRAGVVGLITCSLVLLPALGRWRTRVMVVMTLLICGAYGALIWIGEDQRFASRVQTLSQIGKVVEGRMSHWREVFPLIRDVRWTGSGWGTYSRVCPLYLTNNNDRWFQHAENQYIEVLVEAGSVGLALFIGGLLLFVFTAARAIRSDPDGRQLSAGISGVLATMGIATISLTDFSLAIGGVLFTFMAIQGSVVASFSRTQAVSRWSQICRGSRIWPVLLQVVLLLGSTVSLYHLHFASEIETIADLLPTDEELPVLTVDRCDELLQQLNSRGIRHPEHPELLRTASQLNVYRYRRQIYDDMVRQPQAANLQPQYLWNLTHIERLDAVTSDMNLRNDQVALRSLLDSREVRTNLPQALTGLSLSLKKDPLSRRTALTAAWLAHLLGDPTATSFRDLALVVGASDSTTLYQLGLLSERMNQPEVNQRCWNRCLTIAETWAQPIWDQATQTRDEREAMSILPDRLSTLMAISRLSRDLTVRSELLDRCRKVADLTPDLPTRTRAELEMLLGRLPQAVEAYRDAIREAPKDVDLRMEASVALVQSGLLQEALETLEIAGVLAPRRHDVQARLQELSTAGHGPAAPAKDLPNSAEARKSR